MKRVKKFTNKNLIKKNFKKKTGGQILINCLYNEGVRVIFGLAGIQMYHAIMPILEYSNIRFKIFGRIFKILDFRYLGR